MENLTENIQYANAQNRVRQERKFYIHLVVFVIVNFISNYSDFHQKENWTVENKWGLLLWAFALLNHGLSVFLPNFIFSKNWEERKMQEILRKSN